MPHLCLLPTDRRALPSFPLMYSQGTSTLEPAGLLFRRWSKVLPPPSLPPFPPLPCALCSDNPRKIFPEPRTRRTSNLVPVAVHERKRDVGNRVPIHHVAIRACVRMHARVCTREYVYGLTLWCCMMAVAFRLADIFSSPGCPLCPPLRSGKYLPRRSLYPTVRPCPPVSPPVSLSFALPSVFPSYWRAISVHPKAQRRSRGTQRR